MTAYQQDEAGRKRGERDGRRGTPSDLWFADGPVGDAYRRGYWLGREHVARRGWVKKRRAESARA